MRQHCSWTNRRGRALCGCPRLHEGLELIGLAHKGSACSTCYCCVSVREWVTCGPWWFSSGRGIVGPSQSRALSQGALWTYAESTPFIK